ncbi:uncharacterized protein LOC128985173 [Macrosteles quadrilineatus]|uniref:uncharacterized protein LOC128985173 n=1 Tax=Macrosteles quadrilineatus TaxID=74068 RepID=UPI0023E1807C|nr:uncharacterized protein LOC128985173 [Macrosteles quadrilineatus]
MAQTERLPPTTLASSNILPRHQRTADTGRTQTVHCCHGYMENDCWQMIVEDDRVRWVEHELRYDHGEPRCDHVACYFEPNLILHSGLTQPFYNTRLFLADHAYELLILPFAPKSLFRLYLKPVNEIYARHKLRIRRQESGECIDTYVESLKRLSKDCNFKAVNAVSSRDEYIRDTFIDGLLVPHIRQRLLESSTLSLDEAVSQARSLELAKYHSEQYNLDKCLPTINAAASKPITEKNPYLSSPDPTPSAAKPESYPSQENIACSLNQTCYFCGFKKHNRAVCPAKEAICRGCGIKGHYQKVCRKSKTPTSTVKASVHQSNCIASVPSCLSKAVVPVQLNGVDAYALIDTGSSGSFINQSSALRFNIPVIPCNGGEVSMASTTLRSSIKGYCKINLKLQDHTYKNVVFSVLTNLCSDIIIGHDILKRHSSLQVQFGGKESPLNICSVALANVEPVELFRNLSPDCKLIATKSRRHSAIDEQFIESEIQLLLKEGIIEESRSPWRAQVLVVSSDNHKQRMVVDYSQTINRFTELDAFPLPRIDDIVNKVASYKVYSSIDLKSAYHQIPITENDKPYTAFEACGNLYQFTRVPFGVRNGVPAFQRTLTNIITYEKLEGVQVYLDDITICGNDQAEHDRNLSNFMKAVSKYNLTLNNNSNSLHRALGMFSHYSQFIPKFSEKVSCLNRSSFPLNEEAKCVFQRLKQDIVNAVTSSIDCDGLLTVETDASNHAIGAALTIDGRPVAFFSRTLTNSEQKHSSIEKEAYAIVEALRKWRHYLIGRHFRLITDQRSVAFMFSDRNASKIKNDKIGPLPSKSRNRYLLIVVDEYSRFPFAFPTQDTAARTVILRLKELFSMFGVPAYIHSDRGSCFMSQELKSFLCSLGVATSRTTAYNPQGNGQAERYVGIIWKTIELSLKSKNLDISDWEKVHLEALHSIRSLLCTSTNTTPHERLFLFSRRSSNGKTTPSWLMNPGPVLMKRPVRSSKYEPLVEEVLLLEGNPEYSHIRYADGRETTVSSRQLAPVGEVSHHEEDSNSNLRHEEDSNPNLRHEEDSNTNLQINERSSQVDAGPEPIFQDEERLNQDQIALRRSSRSKHPPLYLKDYVS